MHIARQRVDLAALFENVGRLDELADEIRLGLYLPLEAQPKAVIGDKVYAAESVLAWLTPPTTNTTRT